MWWLEKKNKPFVPHIGSLALCCWLIWGHIGRGDLESREDDITLSAWVSGLRGRFQEGKRKKCLRMYFHCVVKTSPQIRILFLRTPRMNECCSSAAMCSSHISYVKHTVNPYSTDWLCYRFITRLTTSSLSTLDVCVARLLHSDFFLIAGFWRAFRGHL